MRKRVVVRSDLRTGRTTQADDNVMPRVWHKLTDAIQAALDDQNFIYQGTKGGFAYCLVEIKE